MSFKHLLFIRRLHRNQILLTIEELNKEDEEGDYSMRRGWRNNDSIVRLNNFFKHELDAQIRELKSKGYILLNRGTHPNENGFWAHMQVPDKNQIDY